MRARPDRVREGAPRRVGKLRHHHALVAIGALDVFVFGQGLITASLGLLAVFHVLRAAVDAVRGRRELVGDRLVRAAQCAFVCAGASAILYVQAVIAQDRAERAVRAVERHHARVHRWPESLASLGLSTRAQPLRLMGELRYIRSHDGEAPLLLYPVIPPFGRRTYSFERRRWGYLD